jgi:release factor glutamine methyltransferase
MTDPDLAALTVAEALAWAVRALWPRHEGARIDAEVLLAHALERGRAYLYAHPERVLGAEGAARLAPIVARRARGEPVAYLVGRREFWSLDLAVSRHTLIPRPETERLVAAALERIPGEAPWRVADLGTGCGAIAIAIAVERPRARVTATDRSAEALAIAARNIARLAPGNVRVGLGDWCEALEPEPFDLIASNPPYVAAEDPHLQAGDVAFEPREALVAGVDGLLDLTRIARDARRRLRPGGWLVLEHGPDQGRRVREVLRELGYGELRSLQDLGARERVTEGRWPGAGDC